MRAHSRFRAAFASLAVVLTFSGLLATQQSAKAASCDWLNALLGNCSTTPSPTPPCNFLQQLLGQCSTTPTPTPTPTPTTPVSTVPGCTNLPKPGGGTWECTFADNFDGTAVDANKWSAVTTKVTGLSQSDDCWIDSPNNISVGGGNLHLTSRKEAVPFTCEKQGSTFSSQYTSGSVMSTGKFFQTYGRFEISAAMPASKVSGLHSALWMWREDQSGLGAEIDIAEYYTQYPDRLIPYVHYLPTLDPTATNNFCMIADPENFHTYLLEWDSEGVKISYDGATCLDHTFKASGLFVPPAPFNKPFFINLTQALGVAGTGNAFNAATELPATMKVDYVKVWK